MRHLAEFAILSSTPYVWVNADRKLMQSSFVTYRDAEGRVGSIVVPKVKPSVAEVEAALKERAKKA